ncbi:hypothetical protein P43SY_002932 [Pythium insidiosum]|uniref:FHA domain-containing protein n=1 Tax=Pythium insidiosum TaxID=114742 RepID=A0AAD5L9B1_PYTIN|nr:hypothetical protein P43SY_002932 [Pythium insidiosum]
MASSATSPGREKPTSPKDDDRVTFVAPSSSVDSRKRRFEALTASPRSAKHVEDRQGADEDDALHDGPLPVRSPVLQMWSASSRDDGPTVTRATPGAALSSASTSTSASASPASSSSAAATKTVRTNDRDAPFGLDQISNKRYRASPFSAPSLSFPSFNGAAMKLPIEYGDRQIDGFLPIDRATPGEIYHAKRETSENLMDALSLSQQNTQECTQTLEESPTTCVIRLVLHPEVDRALTVFQKNDLEKHGLYRIELHRLNPRVNLGRDSYSKIFDKKTSGIDPVKLSRTHCIIECAADQDSNQVGAFITDRSTNGIRINGLPVTKGKRIPLQDGQTITLLSSRQGNVLLGYVVENPHVRAAQVPMEPRVDVSVGRSQEASQQTRMVEEHTLGVLFAAPLVGKDVQGKYHPIAELDIKREYTILQQSLLEASRYARRPVTSNENGDAPTSSGLFQYPHQINVCAKFANTETFRGMVTIGCRALHFSGHGDERHLYFEDGMGLVHPIPHSSLQELFVAGGLGESTLRLAFVSACSSAPLAHAFVACGIPHVIGVKTNQKIEDFAAIEFTRSFYLALARGKSVGASFTIAQQSVAKSPNIRGPMEVADKFLLLPEGADHSEVIFPLVTMEANSAADLAPLKLKRYPKLWFDDLPAICQGFCNRAVEVYKICLALMLTQSRITRLVTICGEEGIGKTAVAHAVANYVGPRVTSEGGVKFFPIAKLAQEEMDYYVTSIERKMNIDKVQSTVLSRLESMVKDHLAKHKTRLEFNAQQILLIFDGCDCLLQSVTRRERFRHFLSDLLTNNPSLKIILTARHGERVYELSRFSAKMAAKMLLSLVSRPIRPEEVQRSRMNGATTDKLELIASHPALMATAGIPKRIADLAGKLNESLMDDVPVDEAAMELME